MGDTLRDEILDKLEEETASGLCEELTTIWTELWDEDEREKRKHILAKECQKEIKEFLEEVLKNEKKVRDDYITRIEELLSEIHELQTTLEIPIPYEDIEDLPLHLMATRLNKKAEKYRLIRNERIHKLNELAEKEAALCEKLGMLRTVTDSSDIPTKAKIKLLENQIAIMEEEKVNRTVTFLEQRQAIIKLFNELGIEPSLNFEKEIVSEEIVENYSLSNENMKKLDELLKKLEKESENAKERVNDIQEKVKVLWTYLGESTEYIEEFLSKNSGFSINVINAFTEELTKCETKKKENISVIVERIREVLKEEWDRCLIGKEEREKFRPFYINCFTEDLCDLHEFEIKRLKSFYRDNEQIYILTEKHKKLFNKLLELENKSKNANRYYNRGGQLLQEEKERRVITKELPMVEEELRNLLKKYKEDHNQPFTAHGVPLESILDEQWNAHFDQKTIDKLSRKRGDKKKTPLGKRVCTTPYTPLSANKVSRLGTEKVTPASKFATPKASKRNLDQRTKTPNIDNNVNTTLILEPTYDDFQSALQAKVERSAKNKKPLSRSTAINDVAPNILRERNTPNKVCPVTSTNTTPTKISPPMWTPTNMKTPKTVPRARRHSKMTRLTPARNRLPIII